MLTGIEPRALAGGYFALTAYTIWGLAPIYFRAVGEVPPFEIIAHRVVWSVVLLLAVLAVTRQMGSLNVGRRQLVILFGTAILLSINWLVFVTAVTQGQVIATSLGYFINPLVSVFLGLIFLKETLRPVQWLALIIAFSGVSIQVIDLGELPIISLTLAFSFGFYGLIRKQVNLPAVAGLTLETLLVLPIALGYLLYLSQTGALSFGQSDVSLDVLLIAGGAITSVPLMCFAAAVIRLPLVIAGLFQYLAPTLSLLLAIFVFGEPFSVIQLVSFSCVWVALALFTAESLYQFKRAQARLHSVAEAKP
ncbi:MAG: EamA family transporter RarD [Gammaproteobacteria bacterium]